MFAWPGKIRGDGFMPDGFLADGSMPDEAMPDETMPDERMNDAWVDGTASRNGLRTHYSWPTGGLIECATWGPPPSAAPTFLLCHEGLGSIDLWRQFPANLSRATGCGVFAYSRLGYGRSSAITQPLPVTRMADEARDILPELIGAIEPTALILVGHSDGGTIGAHYLAQIPHPALIGAVLIAPHFFCEASNISAIEATRAAYISGALRGRLSKYHDDVDGAFHGWAATWLAPSFADWDMRADIAKWRHPVLFVQGREDPYGSPAQAEAAARSACTEVVWIEHCAHSPHLEQGETTLAHIQKFVAPLLRASGHAG